MSPETAAEVARLRAVHADDSLPSGVTLAPFECVWVDTLQVHDEICYFWPSYSEMFTPQDGKSFFMMSTRPYRKFVTYV